jgi:hypothetical protein
MGGFILKCPSRRSVEHSNNAFKGGIMRRVLSTALAALAFLGAGRALAQQPESTAVPAVHRVIWTFDPVHGTLQATSAAQVFTAGKPNPAVLAAATASTQTFTGTVDITVTVNLISALPHGAALRCSGTVDLEYQVESTSTVNVLSSITGNGYSESVDAAVAGSAATCKFTIPYSWTVPASNSTTLVTIEGITGAVGIAADQLDSEGVVVRAYRSTTVQLSGPVPLPKDGATTTLTASTVL